MKEILSTPHAAPAVGAYSQGCEASGTLVFTSGQIALTPEGELKNTGTIEEETQQVLANLEAILHESASTLANVVKVNISITDIDTFTAVDAVYKEHMPKPYPARECVGVYRLPCGARVEISMIAVKNT